MTTHRKLLTLVLAVALVVGGGVMSAAAAGSNTISGTVTGESGAVVDGAIVRLSATADPASELQVTTGESGQYSFANLADGEYFISSYDPQGRWMGVMTPTYVSVGPGNTSETVDLYLIAYLGGTSSFSGVVTDAATGSPVTNAHLSWSDDNDAGPLQQDVDTSTGKYMRDNLPPGNYELTISAPGYITKLLTSTLALDEVKVLNIQLSSVTVESPTEPRLAGSDRFATAVAVSQHWAANFGGKVYVANGFGYADALSAGPAAAHSDSPLLLTAPGALPGVVVTELNRLKPSEIVIVGGVGAVSASVKTALGNLSFHPTVTRVSGADRYATSRAIADATWADGSLGTVYLATGMNFPDALSASPAAAHFDGPVVLVPGTRGTVDATTLALLDRLGVDKVKIAGGAGVVSVGIESQMKTKYTSANVKRNGGANRYATSVAINADEFSSATTVYLAAGTGFPDALAGAALAGTNNAPLFVSTANCIPSKVKQAIDALNPTTTVILGGTGVLSTAVQNGVTCTP